MLTGNMCLLFVGTPTFLGEYGNFFVLLGREKGVFGLIYYIVKEIEIMLDMQKII
jgi:hypothetical protein